MARLAALAGIVLLSLAGGSSAACQYFYSGYCPGGNCVCTFGSSCSNSAAISAGWSKLKRVSSLPKSKRCAAAGGYCRKTGTGCSGSSCKANLGACAASPSPVPSGPSGPNSYGVDVGPATVTSSVAACFVRNKVSYAIMRVSRTTGTVDYNGLRNVVNAQRAGIKEVDGYIFPTFKKSATTQVYNLYKALKTKRVTINRLWLDIEKHDYSNSYTRNRAFVSEMLTAAKKYFPRVGFYTSKTMWESILGRGYTLGSNLPLWYSHYDKRKDFSRFKPFGGWTKPTWKQYAPDVKVCGVGTDVNWRPSGSSVPPTPPTSGGCSKLSWNGSGYYCSPDGRSLWYCRSRTSSPKASYCANGCVAGRAGSADKCRTASPVAPSGGSSSREYLRCSLTKAQTMARKQTRMVNVCDPNNRSRWGLDISFIGMCVKATTGRNPPTSCSTRKWRAGSQQFKPGDVIATFRNPKTYAPQTNFWGHTAVFISYGTNGCLNVYHSGWAGRKYLFRGTICASRYCRLCNPSYYYKVRVAGYNNGGYEELDAEVAEGGSSLSRIRDGAGAAPLIVAACLVAVVLIALLAAVVVRRRQSGAVQLVEMEEPLEVEEE